MANREHRADTRSSKLNTALRRARRFAPYDRRAIQAEYDAQHDRVKVLLDDGIEVAFPRNLLQGLENAARREIGDIELLGHGTGLHWPQLDVDHYLPGLLNRVFGTERWMRIIGRRGGAVRTPAKAAAARANGRRGGRPAKRAG